MSLRFYSISFVNNLSMAATQLSHKEGFFITCPFAIDSFICLVFSFIITSSLLYPTKHIARCSFAYYFVVFRHISPGGNFLTAFPAHCYASVIDNVFSISGSFSIYLIGFAANDENSDPDPAAGSLASTSPTCSPSTPPTCLPPLK